MYRQFYDSSHGSGIIPAICQRGFQVSGRRRSARTDPIAECSANAALYSLVLCARPVQVEPVEPSPVEPLPFAHALASLEALDAAAAALEYLLLAPPLQAHVAENPMAVAMGAAEHRHVLAAAAPQQT